MNALIIFIKNPIAGKVKTRLAKSIGNEKALVVYEQLLQHTRTISSCLECDKLLYYSNFIDEKDSWPAKTYNKRVQAKGSLGKKMSIAFEEAFIEGYKKVVIIGSDCLELDSALITSAFKYLNYYDAVIGPAADGGYYLLGLNQPLHTLFTNKQWSTPTVLGDTVNNLKALGKTYHMLPILHDIDYYEDLKRLRDKFLDMDLL